MKHRIRKAVLLIAFISLISALTGRFILPLLGISPKAGLMTFISGLAATVLAWRIFSLAVVLEANIRAERRLGECFPQSVQELRSIGVQTELDFIQAVRAFLGYTAMPYFTAIQPKDRVVALPAVFKRSTAMFEEMFGRKPEGYESGDWAVICELEVFSAFGKTMKDMTEEEFQARLSENVREYFRMMSAEARRNAGE